MPPIEPPNNSDPARPSDFLRRRHNMVHRTAERWRPPLFTPPTTPLARISASLRRFLDLQAGSIWRDLKSELARPHGVVLDVGCGAQPYRPLVNPADHYTGIDIAASKEYFGYEVPGTLYYSGDTWPVPDSSADLTLCTETLEHVPDPAPFLDQAARVTKPGGTLLLTVPFAARWHFIPHDYWRFTPSSLRDLLENHGFTHVAVFARGNHVTVACYKLMALILPLLMPTGANPLAGVLLRLIGLLFTPVLLPLAIIANLTLLGRGGDDCLGYTTIAIRKKDSS
jgi:SAM-dependent methyltransferase